MALAGARMLEPLQVRPLAMFVHNTFCALHIHHYIFNLTASNSNRVLLVLEPKPLRYLSGRIPY